MIECEDLVKVYGEGEGSFSALRGISLRIEPGEFAAVTGPSGCGKSTLMHLVGLLDRPTAGRLTVLGRHVEHLTDTQRTHLRRKGIGFVFQAFNLLPRLTAVDNVCLPMSYEGVPRPEREARALELLGRVGLAKRARATPLELSGGERQRVGIARALANRPSLLLADEPTGNLDSKSSGEILELFKELNSEGTTVVLVTHDPRIAASAARMVRILDGRLA